MLEYKIGNKGRVFYKDSFGDWIASSKSPSELSDDEYSAEVSSTPCGIYFQGNACAKCKNTTRYMKSRRCVECSRKQHNEAYSKSSFTVLDVVNHIRDETSMVIKIRKVKGYYHFQLGDQSINSGMKLMKSLSLQQWVDRLRDCMKEGNPLPRTRM